MNKAEVIDSSPQHSGLEAALRHLARLVKAVRYYPARHPALAAAAAEARLALASMLTREEQLLFAVRRDGFLHAEVPVANGHPILAKLAGQFFARRIQTVLFLPDINDRDLQAFARCLALEPMVIQQMGGIADIMSKVRIATLWVNETDLGRIRARREDLERDNFPPGDNDEELTRLFELNQEDDGSYEENDLEMVLNEIRRAESDQHYRKLLQELVNKVRSSLAEMDPYLVIDALLLLHHDMNDPGLSTLRRGLARQAMDQLASDDLFDFLTEFLCSKSEAEETRRDINLILSLYPESNVPRLMQQLAREEILQARRHLLEALVSFGRPAIPFLTEFLQDWRWFVVRNAVAVLGDIRTPEAAASLPPLLHHHDIRVAREAIRALTKIGGSRAVGILLPLLEGTNSELSLQALLSLGAMKNQAAVPALLKLVSRPDPLLKRAEMKKGAIKALGEIGALEAVPMLVTLLNRNTWWRRELFDQLRAAAAAALGEIGGSAAVPALERALEDPAPPVARAAANALKQIRKSE